MIRASLGVRMTQIRDQRAIRCLLSADSGWSLYAIGDLDPAFFDNTQWFSHGSAVALLFKGFNSPVLFTLGKTAPLQGLLREVLGTNSQFYLSVQNNALQIIKQYCTVQDEQLMFRMVLDTAASSGGSLDQRTISATDAMTRLTLKQVPLLRQLYADGVATGEAPDFFTDIMVEQGIYFGIFDGDQLIAAAGTHLVSEEESVAAVGCVYTHRRHRGRKLSQHVTGAVVGALIERGIKTIGLNVKASNTPAIAVYEKLGFRRHCLFYEGLAILNSTNTDSDNSIRGEQECSST
jgi:ribosomal protein S18 acetylase RimI-like enzyme